MRIGAVNVFEDNEGAINLAVKKHASLRTKHIDAKHHLVTRETRGRGEWCMSGREIITRTCSLSC